MLLKKKMVLSTVGVGAALLLSATTVWATSTDTDDHYNVAAGTTVTGNLKTGTQMVFHGTINGIPITVNCTKFTASGKTPATGLVVTLSTPPTISGCKDTVGGTDTITTNSTNGKWKLTGVDLSTETETATEPNTGDKAALHIPMAGATFTSSILRDCVLTVAPTGAVNVTGTYNDAGTIQDTNKTIPVTGAGCSSSTSTVTATVILSPAVFDVS